MSKPLKRAMLKLLGKKEGVESMRDDIEEETAAEESASEAEDSRPLSGGARERAEQERFKARVEALDQGRKITNERFLKVAEEIGTLRGGIMAVQQDVKNVAVGSAKAVQLVESIQPEQFYAKLEKQRAVNETLIAKTEQNKQLSDRILAELREVRDKMALFRGVEQTLKLNKEAQEKLRITERISAQAKQHADKVDELFIEFQKRSDRLERFEKTVESAHKDSEHAVAVATSAAAKVDGFASKQDISALRKETEDGADSLLKMINDLKKDLAVCLASEEKGRDLIAAASKLAKLEKVLEQRDKALRTRLVALEDSGRRRAAAQDKALRQSAARVTAFEKALRDLKVRTGEDARLLRTLFSQRAKRR